MATALGSRLSLLGRGGAPLLPNRFPRARLSSPPVGRAGACISRAATERCARAIAPGILGLVGDACAARLAHRALRGWLGERARVVLVPALAECARRLGYRYQQVAIRRQRTRWGSCSTRGTISLNSCLMFQTPEVMRYLLLHELVHTRHMNHSRAFWQEVSHHCPHYQRLDTELLDGWRRVPSWVFGKA